MIDWLNINRDKLEQDLLNSKFRKYISPIYFGQYIVTLPTILENARGKLIDLGCGNMPFRNQIIGLVENYDGADIYPFSQDIKYVTDIQNMTMIPDESYDIAICLEVLEHVPRPFEAIKEIRRILVPNGKVVLSVPHLSRLHDMPNDYFRFTSFGLEYLFKEADLDVTKICKRGGIFSFLGHQFSLFILSATWGIPLIKWFVFFINMLFISILSFYLDNLLKTHNLFPAGYTVVGAKR